MLSGDPVEVFKRVAQMIGELLDVRVVCLSEIRGDELYFISVYVDGEVMTDAGHCPLKITPCATVQQHKDIRIYDEVIERFPDASFLKTHNAYSYCGFPSLDSSGNVLAVTCLLDDKPHEFSEDDLDLLRIFGQRIAIEIERKRTEEKLRASEARFDLAIRGSSDGLWYWDIRTGDYYFSHGFIELLGYDTEDSLPDVYDSFLSLLHPDEADMVNDAIQDHLKRHEPYNIELLLRRKDGSYGRFLSRGQASWDENGTPLRMAGSVSDVTERKSIESALNILAEIDPLADMGDFFRVCLTLLTKIYGTHFAFIGLISNPEKTRVEMQAIYAGGEFVENFEYELAGTPCADILDRKKEIIRCNASALYPEDEMLVSMGVESYFGAPLVTSTGETIGLVSVLDVNPLEIFSWMEPILGTFANRIASAVEHHRGEQLLQDSTNQYRSLVESSLAIPWELDVASFRFTYVGPQAVKILGYPVEEWYKKDFFTDKLHPDDREETMAFCLDEAQYGRDHEFEYRMMAADGRVVWMRDNVMVTKEEGIPVRLQGYMFDITTRKKAEDALQHAYDDLENKVQQRTLELTSAKNEAEIANKAKTEFLSRMSHELRTPMHAILGFGELLQCEKMPDNQAGSINEIMIASKHLMHLIDELLDLSRIESGEIELKLESFRAADLIGECADLVRPLLGSRGISLTVKLCECEDPFIVADRVRLREVMFNFLSNAVKYNRENGSIILSCENTMPSILRITVTDTGYGLTEEEQKLVFDPFNRLGQELTDIEGTGIGLTICKTIVPKMGGQIGIQSIKGEGCSFWVEMPVTDAKSDSDD